MKACKRRLEGPTRRLRRPSGRNRVFHVPVTGWFLALVCGGRWAFQRRTGWVLVREKVRWTPSGNFTVMVFSAMWTVTTVWVWVRPKASFWPAIMMTPVAGAAVGCVDTSCAWQ
jgi:hypothetical protein